jgi:hypothetical protein
MIAQALFGSVLILLAGCVVAGFMGLPDTCLFIGILANILIAIRDIVIGGFLSGSLGAVFNLIAALVFYLLWRRYRRTRRKAPRFYGYKARAWIAKLVTKLRQALKPRQALRPVPGHG